MAIEYVKDGANSVKAAEKIKIVLHDKRMSMNPFILSRVQPIASESINTGGGLYRFETILGIAPSTRRTAPVTSTAVTFGNNIAVQTLNLTVDQPLELADGKPRPLSLSDVKQLDGIDFSAISTKQVTNSLIQGEIFADQENIFGTGGVVPTDVRVVEFGSTGALDELKLIKTEAAKYLDINDDTMPEATKYFDSGIYGYDKAEVIIYLNPIDEMKYSNAVTDAGAGSDFQYKQFESGQVPFIGGFRVVVTRWVPSGKVAILPPVLGVPDGDIMLTQIVLSQVYDGTKIIYGKHYYDSILVAPELVTLLTPAAPVVPSKGVVKKASKEAIKEAAQEAIETI